MSEQANKSRFAIDLDDLEKQLKTPAPAPARSGDALSELARIVGRDDPLKGLFAQRQGQANAQVANAQAAAVQAAPARVEPSFHAVPSPVQPASNPADHLKGALDEFDALLRRDLSSRGQANDAPAAHANGVEAPHVAIPDPYRPVEPGPSAIDARLREVIGQPAAEPELRGSTQDVAPEPPLVDPFIDELDQHGRVGLDRPGLRPTLEERRAPHDLDEPREAGRMHRPPVDDQLSRDLDEQVQAYPMPPSEPLEDMRTLEPRKSRKGLITIGALLGVAVIGVVGAASFRSGPKAPSGEPPVIKAETGPNKVAPQSPGGSEVPNQNKQIYERASETKAADTKVVSREEQPLDVAQAARSAARVILPGPATPAPEGTATASPPVAPAPAAPANATASPSGLGEPRKVRTVSIRPDGTAATVGSTGTPPAESVTPTPPSRTSAAPTMVLPPSVAPKPVAAAPKPAPAPRPVARPAQEETDAAAPPAAATPAPRAKTQERAGERVASLPPAATSTETARETPVAAGGGGFAVQLGAPGSEAEARSTFAALQRKYPGQLGGQSPLIRKAEVNGREVYRLRVGPMSREGAASLCTQLQGAGGQCFIAKN